MYPLRSRIFKKTAILVSIFSLLVISGCGIGPDNGWVTIYNNTDRTIRVFYEYEEELNDSIEGYLLAETKSDAVSIPAGWSDTIRTKSSFLFEGDFTAVYGGIVSQVEFTFTILDLADVDIYVSRFENEVLPP